MATTYNGHEITMDGVIHENEAMPLREHLKTTSPLKIDVYLHECKDMHTSVIQILCAYKINYECEIHFDENMQTAYRKALEGCRLTD